MDNLSSDSWTWQGKLDGFYVIYISVDFLHNLQAVTGCASWWFVVASLQICRRPWWLLEVGNRWWSQRNLFYNAWPLGGWQQAVLPRSIRVNQTSTELQLSTLLVVQGPSWSYRFIKMIESSTFHRKPQVHAWKISPYLHHAYWSHYRLLCHVSTLISHNQPLRNIFTLSVMPNSDQPSTTGSHSWLLVITTPDSTYTTTGNQYYPWIISKHHQPLVISNHACALAVGDH